MYQKKSDQRYRLGNVSLNKIRNRTEKRVIRLMQEVLLEYPEYRPDLMDIQDIYALTMNHLPPHYVQQFTIVLQEKTDSEQIKRAIRRALEQVMENPTRTREYLASRQKG